MAQATVVVETTIPQDIYSSLRAQGLVRDNLEQESRRLMAMDFFRRHVLSLGQAARMADMNLWRFIEFLSAHDVPVIDMSEEELADEFETAKILAQSLRDDKA